MSEQTIEVPLTESELSYLSRSIFRQRLDKPDDESELASHLDPKISVARDRLTRERLGDIE